MLYPFSLPPAAGLTFRQVDGWDCVYCGGDGGRMIPVGQLSGVQVFAHADCAEEHRITDDQERGAR